MIARCGLRVSRMLKRAILAVSANSRRLAEECLGEGRACRRQAAMTPHEAYCTERGFPVEGANW
jgi:hypothetical protein